ncbi:WxL domain-containing protein [Enterococcus sp. AZ058]|uniref:WxL domain-containing protein n=1 Tax=unclassified Enterococcus TaxID=2608891 RepID=UPI003D2A5944
MTTRFRRPMLVLGTTILVMQAVFMPVGMVYAETKMDTEEQELVELPLMKNYLEEEEISDPRFFFTRSRMQGTAEEPLQVTFFSDQEVSEARVLLPEEATLLKDQLPAGISVEEGTQPNEWIVQSKRAQNTFVLPLVVEQVGNYELSVEETTAHLEISEKEETSEEVPVEEIESSDEDQAGQEELKEENGIEEEQENEQPAEEVREPVSEAPQEQQTNEEETDEASQMVEPTIFDGETAEVATMAQFREAVANPDIGIISVQANLTEATANVLTVDRPLLIQGNGYTLTFGINGFYFQLAETAESSVFRIENARITKVGATPLINSTVTSSKNWTVELEDITEVNANTMRLASLPEGNIHFTGGVSNFTRTTSTQTFIVAKEVLATNQAEVTISRGNATVFFSSATVSNPKLTVEQGAAITITTTAGVANTIDLRGENSEVFLQSGELDVATVGTTAVPTDTTNNTISLTGTAPKITINSSFQLTVRSTLAKRGIHLAGKNAQLLINNSEISVTSATQAAINISGYHSSFSSENSTIQLGSTTGITMNMTGESPQLIFDSSVVNVTSTTGQRINLIGASPLVSLANTEMIMNASTGRGIYLQGTTPQVKLDNSQLVVTDTSASQGMILHGTDALLSLSSKSELAITGAGTGALENIQIGNNNARPELSVTGESKLSVTTTSGTSAATATANNAIHLRGADPKATVTSRSELVVSITSNARRGVYLNGDNANLSVTDSLFDVTTVSGQTLNLTGTSPKMTLNKSSARVVSTTGVSMTLSGSDAVLEANESELSIQSTTGQRMNLIGSNPVLNLENSQLDMKATTGRGIYLQGATPQVIMENSQLLMTDTGASQGMYLNGNNPELLVTDSQFDVTTVSGQTLNLTGNSPTVTMNNSDLRIDSINGDGVLLNGSDARLSVIDSTMRVENSNEATGLAVQGEGVAIVNFKTSTINMVESKLEMHSNGEFIIDGCTLEFNANQPASGLLQHNTLKPLIRINSNELNMSITNGTKMRLKTEYGVPIATSSLSSYIAKLTLDVSNNSELFVSGSKKDNNPAMYLQLNELDFLIDSTSMIELENSGQHNTPEDAYLFLGNQGIFLLGAGRDPRIHMTTAGSLNLYSERGSGITYGVRGGVSGIFDAQNKVDTNATFFVRSSISYAIQYRSSQVDSMNSKFLLENPLFYDIISAPLLPAIALAGSSPNYGDLTISKSKFSAWRTGQSSSVQPDIAFNEPFDARLTGTGGFKYVESSTNPEFTNETLGTQGLDGYSRISATNASWAIADELRVPTNADKKIHGRVSLPVGLDDSRPAWDDEAMVTVEVESPSRESTQEYTAKTVGHTNESPGISIYGEEPRGGLFEIDLDEPLEAGSKVRISKVELTSGELTDGFEHQILTETVEVFPIIPPTPAQFSSSIIAQDSTTIQGMTDNLDAEVTATHNGEPLNTESVSVDADGRFSLDLSEVSLEIDDEIQVFLRDAEGSAVAAGVVNPPETNNARGNINPVTEFTFHDVTFEPATTLIVGDLGPVSPVDPMNPEIEVDPENQPKLPEDQGLLSIDFISSFTFGSQAISAQAKRYYAQPQRLLNLDGTLNDAEERPNYIQVSDRRPDNERKGWTLAVTQNNQFTDRQDNQLRGAHLVLNNQQFASVQENGEPTLQNQDGVVLIPEQKIPLVTASNGQGAGTWVYRFGDGESAGESVALEVPPSADPRATTYQTTLTWELSAVPDN